MAGIISMKEKNKALDVSDLEKFKPISDEKREELKQQFKEQPVICISEFGTKCQLPFAEVVKSCLALGKTPSRVYFKYNKDRQAYELLIRDKNNHDFSRFDVTTGLKISEIKKKVTPNTTFVTLDVSSKNFDEQYYFLRSYLVDSHSSIDIAPFFTLFYNREKLKSVEKNIRSIIERINIRFAYIEDLKLFENTTKAGYADILKKTYETLQELKVMIKGHGHKFDSQYEVLIADYIIQAFKEDGRRALKFSIDNFLKQKK